MPTTCVQRFPEQPHDLPAEVQAKVGIALSGGGSHGAFTAGIIHKAFSTYLAEGKLPKVALIAGTSTGSLVAALLTQTYGALRKSKSAAEGELAKLKHVYTETRQEEVGILPSGTVCKIWNLITKGGLMDIEPLKALVQKYYTQELFDLAREKDDKVVYVANVVDMPSGFVEHFFSDKGWSEDIMRQAIFASCAQPVVMTPAMITKKSKPRWSTDGGVREVIPFREPMDRGCTHVLAVALNEPHIDPASDEVNDDPKDVFGRIDRGLSVMNDEVARDDERMARMAAFLNRGKDLLLREGVDRALVERAFPKEGPLPYVGAQKRDPYDNKAYNEAVLREILFFRMQQSDDIPDSNVFEPGPLTKMFEWGVELAEKEAVKIREFLFAAGEFQA